MHKIVKLVRVRAERVIQAIRDSAGPPSHEEMKLCVLLEQWDIFREEFLFLIENLLKSSVTSTHDILILTIAQLLLFRSVLILKYVLHNTSFMKY